VSAFLDDLFNFPFWFTFYDVGRWFQEVWSMLGHFFVGCEQGSMEDVMNFPGWWELELVSDF
jgi:hypothetical protein